MREIKFRAYHFGAGYSVRPEMLYDNKLGDVLRWKQEGQDLSDVMQYTGLTDKNGVEIYEGDIVTATFWDDEQKIYSETAIVDFEEGSFILKLSNDEWSYFNGTQSVEVIGNIHEHPHLLEVSTE